MQEKKHKQRHPVIQVVLWFVISQGSHTHCNNPRLDPPNCCLPVLSSSLYPLSVFGILVSDSPAHVLSGSNGNVTVLRDQNKVKENSTNKKTKQR